MRRIIWTAVAALALAGAGLALADDFDSKAVKSVGATFTATASNLKTTTCTSANGTFALTKGTYSGTATSSDPSLNGPIALDVRSLINTTKNLGTVDGKLKIDTAGGKDTVAHFDAVYSGGSLAGLAEGHAQEPYSRLVANLSAGYSPAGGFTSGKLGDTAGGAAVELTPGQCKPAEAASPAKVEVHGTVTALSATSITVAGVTCTIPANLQTLVGSRVRLGARVEMKCTTSNGTSTLVKIEVTKK